MLEQIGRFLEDLETGEYERGCIALECLNSVPGALLLMALLERGISFVLTPPSGSELKPTPHFAAIALLLSRPTPPPAVPSCPCSIFALSRIPCLTAG